MKLSNRAASPPVGSGQHPKPDPEMRLAHEGSSKEAPMPQNRKRAHKPNQSIKLDAKLCAAQDQLTNILEFVSVEDLRPSAKNPRTHSQKQVRELASSMQEFGFTVPALIDEANRILAGHGRLEAAKLLGLTSIPCVRVSHISEA